MREIRFRQWDSFRKIMYHDIGASPGCWSGFPYVTWERYPIMQYTGLQDRNGTEIYEGDLLKCNQWPDHIVGEIKFNDDTWRLAIELNDPNFGYWQDFESWIFKGNVLTNFTVIGNIHEGVRDE